MLAAMPFVHVSIADGIADVLLSRPKVNAMSQELLRETRAAFERLADDASVKGALVRGEGKAFSAGLDLREVTSLDEPSLSGFLDDFDAAFRAAFRFPKPLAAAVRGHAVAGGLVLAMCADFIAFGAGDFKIGLTELAVGVPFPRVALEIVRHATPKRAFRKLVFEAGTWPPSEVFAMGVGDALCAEPAEEARRWLVAVCSRPAETFRIVKAGHRRDAWDCIAAEPVTERQSLVSAMVAAKQAALAALG
jgi:enoyl-CoA hydratase